MSEIKATFLVNSLQANVTFLKQSLQQESQAVALVEQAAQRVEEPRKAAPGDGRGVDIVI